nr:hypothetical protein [Dyella sp. ASV24]
MIIHITCRTDRFNLSIVGSDFINDCCFGEDFSIWLVQELTASGIAADVIGMEDYGWSNQVEHEGSSYLMNVVGTPEDDSANPNYGEWHVLLERRRTLTQRLLGKNKASRTGPIVKKIAELLSLAGFEAVAVEP